MKLNYKSAHVKKRKGYLAYGVHGLGLDGYAAWKSEMTLGAFLSSEARTQEVSSLVPL